MLLTRKTDGLKKTWKHTTLWLSAVLRCTKLWLIGIIRKKKPLCRLVHDKLIDVIVMIKKRLFSALSQREREREREKERERERV